jgi:hypothetical protein
MDRERKLEEAEAARYRKERYLKAIIQADMRQRERAWIIRARYTESLMRQSSLHA